jgi:hypothetical protein
MTKYEMILYTHTVSYSEREFSDHYWSEATQRNIKLNLFQMNFYNGENTLVEHCVEKEILQQ